MLPVRSLLLRSTQRIVKTQAKVCGLLEKCDPITHAPNKCASNCASYSTTSSLLLKPTMASHSGKVHEESFPAAEKEKEIKKAELLAETGSDRVYNAILHELANADARLHELQNDHVSTEQDIIHAMQDVATIQWKIGMLDEAQILQEEILSKLVALHSDATSGNEPSKHLDIAMTMHTIGSIQSRLDNPREANKWFTASLEMKKELLSDYSFHYEIGKTLNGLALVKMQLDQEEEIDTDPLELVRLLDEAENHYMHHGERHGDDQGEEEEQDMADHPHVASINENIAMTYRKYGDLNMALQKYENALRIHKHWLSDEDINMNGNESIMNLNIHCGDCLQGLESYEEALKRYEEALRLHLLIVRREAAQEEETLAEGSRKLEAITPIAGILKHNIGMMHSRGGRYTEAMIEFQAAMDIKSSFGEHHPEVANTLNAIGAMQASKGEGDSALAHFKQALEIFRMNSSVIGDEDHDEDIHQTKHNIKIVQENLAGRGNSRPGGGRMRGTTF